MSATPTAQEVFDLAVAGVLKQGKRSVNVFGECLYRGPGGLKCAAGFLFTDEEVAGKNAASAQWVIESGATRLQDHAGLIIALQAVHDVHAPGKWADGYRRVATHYDLSPAVIDQWEAEQAGGDS